jgi:hypothetical protein
LKENIEKLYNLLDQTYIADCFKILKHNLNEAVSPSKNQQKFMLTKIEIEANNVFSVNQNPNNNQSIKTLLSKNLLNLFSKFFNNQSTLFSNFEEFMIVKGYQVIIYLYEFSL